MAVRNQCASLLSIVVPDKRKLTFGTALSVYLFLLLSGFILLKQFLFCFNLGDERQPRGLSLSNYNDAVPWVSFYLQDVGQTRLSPFILGQLGSRMSGGQS